MTKQELQAAVGAAEAALDEAQKQLTAFDRAPENNVFDSVEDASATLEERLLGEAREDCEGSHNCGADEYTQEFIVDGKHYMAKLTCEYNRHDKTYYYIDGHDFTVEPVEA